MDRLYERSSRRCEAAQIGAVLRAGIDAHAEAHHLGEVWDKARHCCDTRSVRLKRPGLLSRFTGSGDPDAEHRTVVLVTAGYLVVAVSGEKRGVHVSSARLDGLSLASFERGAGIDFGVSATGLWSGGHTVTSHFIGVGDDPDGRAFLNQLHSAIAEAKDA